MARFVMRRLVMLIVTLLVSSFAIYSALYVAPGNPIATLTGGRTPSPRRSKCSRSDTTSTIRSWSAT